MLRARGPRRLPFGLRPRERRVCQRVAAGLTPAQAARAEGVADAEVEGLLARPCFAAVVDAYRALDAMDEATRLARLERIAWIALENALADGDLRAAMFVLRERAHGRNPARTLAERVAAGPRPAPWPAAAPSEASAEAGPRPRRYDDPCPSALAKGAARATEQAAAEEAARQVALTEMAADEDAEEITPALPARRGSATVSPRPAGGDDVVPSARPNPAAAEVDRNTAGAGWPAGP